MDFSLKRREMCTGFAGAPSTLKLGCARVQSAGNSDLNRVLAPHETRTAYL